MDATSPKGKDLERGSAYVLHSSVADNDGSNGEFQLTGYAQRVADAESWSQAASLALEECEAHHILFELGIIEAFSTVYRDDDPVRTTWNTPADRSERQAD